MTKEQILKNADACAEEADKLRKENECNNAKIDALIERESVLRKQAASVLSPEQVFLDIIDGCTIKIDKLKYPNSIFLFKGDDWMFEIENSNIWCRLDKVWERISEAISGDYQATLAFLKMQLDQHFKMKGVTPRPSHSTYLFVLDQHFKMKGVTPIKHGFAYLGMLDQHFKMKGVTPAHAVAALS